MEQEQIGGTMYNNEFEYIGTTIHYIDEGVDTGDIISYEGKISLNDTPHNIGNKNIVAAGHAIKEVLKYIEIKKINGISQKLLPFRRELKMREFTSKVLDNFYSMLNEGLINNWVNKEDKINFDLVNFNFGNPKICSSLDLMPIEVN